MVAPDAQRSAPPRAFRPSGKVLPEHARGHNRSLVLQTLYRGGLASRADLARETGLTRVTISDLVAELMNDDLVIETGQRGESRPGKPAILLDINRTGFQIVGVDLSETGVFRGAVLDLDGTVVTRLEVETGGASGAEVTRIATRLTLELVAAADRPLLGVGIGSPGVVGIDGTVLSAPNLGWEGEPLQATIAQATGLGVVVANDANAAALAERSFGDAQGDLMLIRVGRGVGAGLIVGGTLLHGSRFAAGEIGHVVVGTDGGALCACGKHGCLETWLAVPHLRDGLAQAASASERDAVLHRAGERLGIALAPVVGALNLDEVVISGPVELLDGPLLGAAIETFRTRTMPEFHGALAVRMSALGQDIVMRGAAAMVLAGRLGVS
ncbi:ROK family transcriptional regulator [Homoserinibacter sp. GY 40078]|uniref:ROK family transcriptional regulator n=1 Tax=Homoserinibacter sp. GY 40078 TaxID=2603275 RepID=UPI0011CBAB10|nr:ROK family transcriptional regulator [Homoserinibacter sp. GY 40078]TXK19268.1 ROK family transcriptional regulator [Homoserinibacter sp. GY 40078]